MKMYDEIEYARSRLMGTIVMHDKEPVFLDGIDGRGRCAVFYLYDMDTIKEVKLKDLDINPVRLGYVNVNKDIGSVYIVRAPMRNDWRQGLRNQNIFMSNGERPNLRYSILRDTIIGNYPTIEECIKSLDSNDNKWVSRAFSRNFSIKNDFTIEYKKTFTVGRINPNNGNHVLMPEYEWVRESYEEEAA